MAKRKNTRWLIIIISTCYHLKHAKLSIISLNASVGKKLVAAAVVVVLLN